jgi:hypothetical protein
MRDLTIEFFVPRVDESKAEGKQMLQMICGLLPEVMPEFYNTYEPVNKRFDSIHVDTALKEWCFSFLWKRRKPSVTGVMFLGTAQLERPTHTHLIIRFKPEIVSTQRLVQFVQEFSTAFRVDFSLVHVLTQPEVESKRLFGLSTFILKESLPNLYWATVFGTPYVKLFGRERLLSTPAAVVKALADDMIYIQLTEDVMDNRKQPERVEAARQAAKKHLDSNAFFDPQLSPNHVYRRPEFHIEAGTLTGLGAGN